jgi:hypothetical protein
MRTFFRPGLRDRRVRLAGPLTDRFSRPIAVQRAAQNLTAIISAAARAGPGQPGRAEPWRAA